MKLKPGLLSLLPVTLSLFLGLGVLAWAQEPPPTTQTRFDGMFGSYDVSVPILDSYGSFIGSARYYVYLAEALGTGDLQSEPVKQWTLNFTVSKTLYVSPPPPSWPPPPGWPPPPPEVVLTGYGPIPDNCVTLGKPTGKNLALSVDISTLPLPPDFGFDPTAFKRTKTCSPDPNNCDPSIDMDIGKIDLKWEWINDFWNRQEGHWLLDFVDYWQHWQGFTDQNAALVSGSLFGIQIKPVVSDFPAGRIGRTRSLVTSHWK